MYPHRMRLLGPWQFEPLARTLVFPDGHIEEHPGSLPGPGRTKIPATYRGTSLDGFRGRVRWRRNFHPPRSLAPNERLWLVLRGVDYFADVSLNGTPLGRHEGYFDPFEFDVTPLVAERNELVVEVDCPAEAEPARRRLFRGSLESENPTFVGGLWREVALEVRSFAFLRDVLMRTELNRPSGSITVTGRVVGEPGVPASLDLSFEDTLLVGQRIEASSEGTAFELEARIEHVQPWWPRNLGEPRHYIVHLELHGAARTLDSMAFRVGFRKLIFDPSIATAELDEREFPVECLDLESSNNPLEGSSDPILGQINGSSDLRDRLVLIRTAGRVVGPGFYEKADLDGLMIWQDFPLCGGHPESPQFRTEAVRQARQMVRQLSRHPCVALWGSSAEAARVNSELNGHLRTSMIELDPTRPCL